MTTTHDYVCECPTLGYVDTAGWLCDYRTGETLRPATPAEVAASTEAAEADGGVGSILAVVGGAS